MPGHSTIPLVAYSFDITIWMDVELQNDSEYPTLKICNLNTFTIKTPITPTPRKEKKKNQREKYIVEINNTQLRSLLITAPLVCLCI